MGTLEDELDAALFDLEQGGSGQPAASDPPAAEELDFRAGLARGDDGFEKERAAEREWATEVRRAEAGSAGPGGTRLADRLLNARKYSASETTANDAAVHKIATACRICRWAIVVMLILLVTSYGSSNAGTYFGKVDPSSVSSCSATGSQGAAVEMASFGKLTSSVGRVWADPTAGGATRAVLFRGFGASKEQVDRVLAAAATLKAVRPNRVDVWVSLDNTHSHNATHLFITELEKFKPRLILGRDLKLHQFVEKDVLRMYPALAPPPVPMSNTKKNKRRRPPPPPDPPREAFTVESTLTWYWHPRVSAEPYSTVWVLDLDAAFTGGWDDLLAGYADDKSDLLALGCVAADTAGAASRKATASSFERYAGPTSRANSPTFVQRLSARFLRELSDCSTRGIVAPEGEAICTLAARASMLVNSFDAVQIGKFQADGAEPVKSTKDITAERTSGGGGKFYHPVS